MQQRSEVRFTYLLTSVTSDRVYAALQIIHQSRSIIIEAKREAERWKACTFYCMFAFISKQKHRYDGNMEA